MKRFLRWIPVACLYGGMVASAFAQMRYEIDGAASKMEVNVYKEGLFKAFGHDHLIAVKELSGTVLFYADKLENSSVTFHVATKSLTTLDPGESEKDRKEVHATMQSDKVLDAARFPDIVFASTGVNRVEKKGDMWSVTLAGKLQLHGVEKPVTVPVTIRTSRDELMAQGEVFLLQTDYGITPIKVGGGAVRVKDCLRIHFEIRARATPKP